MKASLFSFALKESEIMMKFYVLLKEKLSRIARNFLFVIRLNFRYETRKLSSLLLSPLKVYFLHVHQPRF